MNVATLGSVVFFVKPEAIKTIRDFSRTSKADVSVHKIHNKRPVTEFTGVDADTLKFKFTLSANLGVNPRTDYATLITYLRNGTTLKFTCGSQVVGDYRWLIKELKASASIYDRKGNVTEREVEVSLTEYLR